MNRIEAESKAPSPGRRILHFWRSLGARSRIFYCFFIYTLLMLVVIWLLQIVFLSDFYRAHTKRMLASTSEAIAGNIDNDNIQSLIERFAEQNNLCVTITSDKLSNVLVAEGMHNCVLHKMPLLNLTRFLDTAEKEEKIAYFMFPMDAFRNYHYDNKKFIGSVPQADDGGAMSVISVQKVKNTNGETYYIFLNTNMTPLEGTVSTLRNELLFITIILLVLAFVISWLLSKWITKPIVAITKASASLKKREYTSIQNANYREVRQLNERLCETAVELHKVDDMQKELLANISHDLRTPLTLIQGYAEMIRDIPEENTPENMQVIIDETKRLSTLVESVLNLNCLKTGLIASKVSAFSAEELISSMVERYNKLMEKDGYRIHYEHEGDVLLYTDKMQFEQVLQNLINNALTYTGEDKTVTVRQRIQGNKARFEVVDTGSGISEEDLEHIWERYYRSGKPHKRAVVGSGLGLNIVKSILDAGKMEYGVVSNEGEGSNFWFEAELDKET